MSTTNSATASAKTGSAQAQGSNPFGDIVALEEQEKARVAKELQAMQTEEAKLKEDLEKKNKKAEEEQKEAAKNELKEYKDKELSKILKDAQTEAKKEAEALKNAYQAKKDNLAGDLVKQISDVLPKT